MLDELFMDMEEGAEKSLGVFRKDIAKVRTGRASTALLDSVRVDYYNAPTPLNQIASVSVPDARLIVVQPWEKSIIQDVEKAIAAAGLGLNPVSDGNVIRLPIPPLNEERRKDLVKQVKKMAEDSKIAIRNIRRDFNERLKKAEKSKDITEDELHRSMDKIQEITNSYTKKVDDVLEHKEKEIIEI